MVKTAVKKIAGVGRTASMVFGLALVLALMFGVVSMALGATGGNFILGKPNNVATKATGLIGKVASGSALVVKNPSGGSALGLSVGDPAANPSTKTVAPMKVDSQAVVTDLNADKVDGLDAAQLRGARAYARVDSGIGGDNLPHLDIDRTSRFTAVNRPVDGLYCLTPASDIDQQALPAVVSVDWSTTNEPEGNASAMYQPGGGLNCLENQFKVITQRQIVSAGGVLVSANANDIGFTIIVP